MRIRQDAEGRYCLNDLHKAAGGNPTHRPGEFLRLQQTQDLIAEIETAEIPAVRSKAGRGGGTFAGKELVYAYAMWISPRFNLQVIRAYDALVTQPPAPAFHIPQTMSEALRLAADLSEQNANQQK